MSYTGGANLQSQEQLAQSQRKEEEEKKTEPVAKEGQETAQGSRGYMKDLNTITSALAGIMEQNNAKGNIPAYNKHEAQGRSGLIDPSLNGQQTTLPTGSRRQEQIANFNGIANSVAPELMMKNVQILKAVNQTPFGLQKHLKQQDSIYQFGNKDFMVNRINIELMRKRQNSLYALV